MKVLYLILFFLLLLPFFLEVFYNREYEKCLKEMDEKDK